MPTSIYLLGIIIYTNILAEVWAYCAAQVKRGGSRTWLAINARNFAAQMLDAAVIDLFGMPWPDQL